jgi:tryptophan synthase beta chain
MYADRIFDAVAVDQHVALGAGLLFAETENILPAPESAHAVAGAIDLASRYPCGSQTVVILINISGHGLLDINAYMKHRAGDLELGQPDDELLSESLRELAKFNRLIEESGFVT